jgi:signal peptidase II
MKTKTVLLWTTVLFVIDRVVKVVIDRYFINVKFEIIPPVFYFRPTFNPQYSWVNGLFGLGMGFWAHVVLLGFAAIIFVLLYDFMKKISGNRKIVSIAFIFGFAGVMSSFIGTIVWNGCLDYIEWRRFTVFDLKDLYINIFLTLLVWYYIMNWKHLSSLKLENIVRHYKTRTASLFGKQTD